MNNRIKELAEQALKSSMIHDGVYRPEGCANGVSKNFADKFAELIVLSCAAIAKDSQDFYDEHNDGVCNDDIGSLIKHAFGVKE